MKKKQIVACGFGFLAAVLAGGCGGAAAPTPLTQSQALAVTADLFAAMASAPLISGGIAHSVHAPDVAARIRAANLDSTTASASVFPQIELPHATPTTILIPAFTYNCPQGGTIVVAGSFTGTDNETATPPTINVTENILETINQCNEKGLILNGNPSVAITGTVTLAGSLFTDSTTIAGGLAVGNNNNCAINVTVAASFNSATKTETGSINGSVCGVSVNGTF